MKQNPKSYKSKLWSNIKLIYCWVYVTEHLTNSSIKGMSDYSTVMEKKLIILEVGNYYGLDASEPRNPHKWTVFVRRDNGSYTLPIIESIVFDLHSTFTPSAGICSFFFFFFFDSSQYNSIPIHSDLQDRDGEPSILIFWLHSANGLTTCKWIWCTLYPLVTLDNPNCI